MAKSSATIVEGYLEELPDDHEVPLRRPRLVLAVLLSLAMTGLAAHGQTVDPLVLPDLGVAPLDQVMGTQIRLPRALAHPGQAPALLGR